MKHLHLSTRKSSVALATGMGAAVCLKSGGAFAAFVSGNIKGSNSNKSLFSAGANMHVCENKATIGWAAGVSGRLHCVRNAGGHSTGVNGSTAGPGLGYIALLGKGLTVSGGMAGGWSGSYLPASVSDQYFAITFADGGTRYGWVHILSSNAGATAFSADKWGYENAGGTCKTLAESIAASKLSLTGGRAKLLWSNANEDGIARYETQTQNASGAWTTVSSDAAGAGSYAATVPAGAACRIVVEKVDGATEEIGF